MNYCKNYCDRKRKTTIPASLLAQSTPSPNSQLAGKTFSRGDQRTPTTITNFSKGRSNVFMCRVFSWGMKETRKQKFQEKKISGKGRDSAGIILGQSHEDLFKRFLVYCFFWPESSASLRFLMLELTSLGALYTSMRLQKLVHPHPWQASLGSVRRGEAGDTLSLLMTSRLATPPAPYRSLAGPPGPESQEILQRVSRGLPSPGSKEYPERSRNSLRKQ